MMSYFRAHRFDKEGVNDAFGQVAAAIQELDSRNSTASTAANAAALKSIQSQIISIQTDIAALRVGGIAAHGGTHNVASTDPTNIEEGQVNGLVTDLAAKENVANKDATGGYAGLTLFKINFKNALNTFTSFFTNSNTAARTYTFQDRNGTIADDTDLALKAPLASPALTGTPTAPVPNDNDYTLQISTSAFTKIQIMSDTGSHGKSQAINVMAAATGGNGIAIADNANLAFGTTTNVTLVWKGSLPVWGNTGSWLYLIHKRQDDFNRWGLYVASNSSCLIFYLLGSGGAIVSATSTVPVPFANDVCGEITVAVVRETASTAGSVTFYYSGVQLGSAVIIPAGTPPSMTNTGTLYILGNDSATGGKTAGTVQFSYIYNRALSSSDVLKRYRGETIFSDKWGNLAELVTNGTFTGSATGWTLQAGWAYGTNNLTGTNATSFAYQNITGVAGKKFRVTYTVSGYSAGTINVAPGVSGLGTYRSANGTYTEEITVPQSGVDTFYIYGVGFTGTIDDVSCIEIGAVLALEAEGINSINWTGSANGMNAAYPAAGSSLVRYMPYVALTGNQSVAGIKTFTDGAAIKGVTDASSAAAGYVGEYVSSSVSTLTNVPASGLWGDMTSITLPAGDWDVSAVIDVNPQGAKVSSSVLGIGTVSGNNGTGIVFGDSGVSLPTTGGDGIGNNIGASIPMVIKNANVSTTYYCKVNMNYTVGTPQFRCRMSARRIR